MTTPTPEAIEAAARAIFECSDPFSTEECAKAALTAAAPIIAAQAKAEALKEAADACAPDYETTDTRSVAKWLRARAATIAPDVTP